MFIRLLGPFEILKMGQPVALRSGGKAERLLSCLAVHPRVGVHRATLVDLVWPDTPVPMATQCLNTLMHSLKAQLADGLAGQPPVVHTQSHYTLNLHGGVSVDVLEFESALSAGHRLLSQGSTAEAIEAYDRAVALYGGDLAAGSSIAELLERERFRVACLTTLARLADAHFELANYDQALDSALRLLSVDPCREDAHRMVMRTHVRMGCRAQALRQYNLCRLILMDEFDAVPEPATEQLFHLIRSDPGRV
ncbi:BTAD domain-containing putative transcriptional regulator [Rhodococcus sp. T2V]|uniref:AfsR/SARP family transcriptional regulator n=1 Tax=Rhodococcus sp. T2V TaxID=3034164 RepID=UPI0023E33943|nr:BTAD domain-containing putative transcriptional regulator [Rhodococcus sp. T2V]MDF3308915.1 BTAD domain-containing putative transcriptional regulator [Rhodococcus sp. T2V]